MSAGGAVYPLEDSWVAAIHGSEDDFAPLGTALVIDERRVLTCAHVVMSEGRTRDPVWVAFPKAEESSAQRRRVDSVVLPDGVRVYDLAVLVLAEVVPAGVKAAPLRCPRPGDLTARQWWAFGFAGGDPVGNSASGMVGAPLAYGWVRVDAESRYHVAPGFSGGALWSPDYQAVVAVVGEANDRGDGRAITLYQADACFPEEKIRLLAGWSLEETGELALAAWGWTLERDPEGVRHWRPRGRGVTVDSERGDRFRGRRAALLKITDWLDRKVPDRHAMVVTGSPGVGKSAVLGRIVTTADADAAAALPPSDQAVRASPGSVACAVHAKGKTALEVALEIACAASAGLPDRVEDLGPALRTALAERGNRRFNLIIDALDEATTPVEARAIIAGIVLPLVETCADVGAQVIVGARRHDEDGDLLAAFGGSAAIVDLDYPEYFSEDDLTAYAMATLQLAGDERPGNPYMDYRVATAVARRIAVLSNQNFLIAGLTARAHGLHDERAAEPSQLSVTPTVDAAMRNYLRRISPAGDISAEAALTALAFAEAPGIPLELWQAAVHALGAEQVTVLQLSRFARSSAANFLVESGGSGEEMVFRLFHQALDDALMRARSQVAAPRDDERALTQAFLAVGRQRRWEHAPRYLLRSLALHAARAGMIDDLLTDDIYLLHADLRHLIPLADRATSAPGLQRARLLRLTPRAMTADVSTRIALFSITESVESLGRSFSTTTSPPAPYRAKWARVIPRKRELSWKATRARCMRCARSAGQPPSARHRRPRPRRCGSGTPPPAHSKRSWKATLYSPWTVCAFGLDGRTLLASGGVDHTVRIWDPATGEQQAVLEGHQERSRRCARSPGWPGPAGQRQRRSTVRIWDPATGEQRPSWKATRAGPRGVRGHRGRPGPAGQRRRRPDGADLGPGHRRPSRPSWKATPGRCSAVCAFTVDGRELLASGSGDRRCGSGTPPPASSRLSWKATPGGRRGVRVQPGRPDPAGQRRRRPHGADLGSGHRHQQAVLEGHAELGHGRCARSAWTGGHCWPAPAPTDGADLGPGYRPAARCPGRPPGLGPRRVRGDLDGRKLLASGGIDHTVRIWDPATGAQQAVLEGHQAGSTAVCAIDLDGRKLLASGSDDQTVRIWDPATGAQQAILEGHQGGVNAVCAVTVDGRELLASGGDDSTVRIWDPATGDPARRPGRPPARRSPPCARSTVDGRTCWPAAATTRRCGSGTRPPAPSRPSWKATRAGVTRCARSTWRDGSCWPAAAMTRRCGSGTRPPAPSTPSWKATRPVTAVCPVSLDGRELLASGGDDHTVRIWDPATGMLLLIVPVHHQVRAIDYVQAYWR